MTDFTVRPALPRDGDQIVETWCSAFGDGQPFVMDFLAETDLLRSAVVAEAGGQIRSMIFAFDGLRFGERNVSYLYAHCTQPEYRERGMGTAVARAMAERCFAQGADMVCLLPAGEALEQWYRRILGMEVLQRVADLPAAQDPVVSASCALSTTGSTRGCGREKSM